MSMKKALTFILSVSMLALILPVFSESAFADITLNSEYGAADAEPQAQKPFEDVSGHWAKPEIDYVFENGLMNGVSEGAFEPDTAMSRAMLVTVLWRLKGSPTMGAGKSGVFPDVAEYMWYTEAVEWTAAMEIVKGFEDALFRPDESATRQQLALIIYNYARYAGYDVSARAGLEGFADGAEVQQWAEEAMEWAVGAGIIQGRTDTQLAPGDYSTRAEAAVVIWRISQLEK